MTAIEEIAHLADIPSQIDVELDSIIMTVREIMALDANSVIRTGRAAGENITITVGGAAFASGEIVVIEDTVGVRITDFLEEE